MIKFRPPSRTEPPSETARPPTLRSDAEQRRYVRRAGTIRVLEAWRAEKLKNAAEQLQAGTEPSHCLVEIAETTRNSPSSTAARHGFLSAPKGPRTR